MPGCFSYVVAKDSANENAIWVTEVWDSIVSHDASLSLSSVKNAIPRAKAIVSSFEKVARHESGLGSWAATSACPLGATYPVDRRHAFRDCHE
jgi:quinol monooxygenase YgiN